MSDARSCTSTANLDSPPSTLLRFSAFDDAIYDDGLLRSEIEEKKCKQRMSCYIKSFKRLKMEKSDTYDYIDRSTFKKKSVYKKRRASLNIIPKKYSELSEFTALPELFADNQEKQTNTRSESEDALNKQHFVINEFIKSEENYIRVLGLVESYMKIMSDSEPAGYIIPVPNDLQKNSSLYKFCHPILVNVIEICKWHKNTFLPALRKCLIQPQHLCGVFEKLNYVFVLYEIHFQKTEAIEFILNKYEHYFEEIRIFQGHNLHLSCIVMMPLRRIINYNVLLKEVFRCAEIANLQEQLAPLQNAISNMSKLLDNINNVIKLSKLYHFNGDLKIQGELLMDGPMECAERPTDGNPSKDVFRDLYVFLFEKSMIFTVQVSDKQKKPTYFYKDYIPLFGMKLENRNESYDGSFIFRSSGNTSQRRYVCRPVGDNRRFEWIKTIRNLLQNQNDFLDALTNPQKRVDSSV